MIVTPKEIQNWIDKKKEFTVIDIRPAKFQNKNPFLLSMGLNDQRKKLC